MPLNKETKPNQTKYTDFSFSSRFSFCYLVFCFCLKFGEIFFLNKNIIYIKKQKLNEIFKEENNILILLLKNDH